MAISASVEWEVRTTGSDANGGGFKSGASGTDYSLQNAAQVAYTDLVIDASDNTKVTSAGTPFTSAHVGNIIKVTGGTGFTTGRYEVTAVASAVATLDRAVGTTSSTGGTGNLGGGLLTIAEAITAQDVTDQTIWIKSGTYTITTEIVLGNYKYKLYGYNSTHADWGTKPLITSSTTGIKHFSCTGSSSVCFFRNIEMTTSASNTTNTYAIAADANFPILVLEACVFDGFRFGCIAAGGNFAGISAIGCEWKNINLTGVETNYRMSLSHCKFYGGIHISGVMAHFVNEGMVDHCIFHSNNGVALKVNNPTLITNCSFKSNRYAIDFESGADGSIVVNNIFWGNTDVYNTSTLTGLLKNNAYGSNTAIYSNSSMRPTDAYRGDITLTADPFTSSSDFSLNSTSGGGPLLKAAGYDNPFTAASNGLDVGAVQTAAGGSCDYPAVGDVRDGVTFDTGGQTGTLELPAEATVQSGVQYGEDGTEFTGTYSPSPTGVINPLGGIIQ